jgi:hypothetical protein
LALSIGGSYGRRELIPRRLLAPTVLAALRGHEFPVPADPDGYLTHMYGDWRNPPPVDIQEREIDFFDRFVLPRIQDIQQR